MSVELISKLLMLKGKPFVPYPPFEFLFDQSQPEFILLKTGRQVSKTTSVLAQHLFQATTISNFNILYVNPLESQASRASVLILRPLVTGSPFVHKLLLGKGQTFLYSFKNGSNIILSYSQSEADRTRGVPVDKIHIDEVQDIQQKTIPILIETMSASKWGYLIFTGTPKTLNNTLQYIWNTTSQAEWVIKCEACSKWNIPSKEYDLDKMIGPYSDTISAENPGVICAKCGKSIHPNKGVWIHRYPDRKNRLGFHIPQIVLELHYADPRKWALLLDKRKGFLGMTIDSFYQEVLGEASDVAERLLNLDDLLSVATVCRKTDFNIIEKMLPAYKTRVFGIDWGGGGRAGNFTTIALVCMTPSGRIEVPTAFQLLTPHDHIGEAREILKLAERFKPDYIAHDYTGAGALRETILVQSGFPIEKVIPFRYVPSLGGVSCKFVPAQPHHPRACYHIDPSRCLLITCAAIKTKKILFFHDDYINEHDTGLLRHFLSLIDETKYSRGLESYRIVCEPGYNDEFAQATMLGCVTTWQLMKSWPQFQF